MCVSNWRRHVDRCPFVGPFAVHLRILHAHSFPSPPFYLVRFGTDVDAERTIDRNWQRLVGAHYSGGRGGIQRIQSSQGNKYSHFSAGNIDIHEFMTDRAESGTVVADASAMCRTNPSNVVVVAVAPFYPPREMLYDTLGTILI